jgi:23S rRNA (guanosine2251-2'-O)-methyltransferase
VKEKCDFLVALPLKGKISSLNLSVAAGVVLYQILEKRESQRGESA